MTRPRLLVRRSLILILFLIAAWLVAATALFLVSHDDRVPARASAVVVLAGDAGHRMPAGLGLVERGVAPVLVLSREPRRSWRGRKLCDGDTRLHVTCFQANPYSTRGEARAVASLARRRGWTSLVVVTSGYHVLRARQLFERCLAGIRISFDGVGYDRRWIPLDLAFETAKLARAQIQRGC